MEWLPSGGDSDLIRVRGRAESPLAVLPDLVIGGARLQSLPDPHTGVDPAAWRGAYLVPAALLPPGELRLEWPDGSTMQLPPPQQGLVPDSPGRRRPSAERSEGAEVIDRAVLAERRARRAETAEQAQARIAAQALKALELLEKRGAELEQRLDDIAAERDALLERSTETDELRARAEAAEARAADAEARLEAAGWEHAEQFAAEVQARARLELELEASRAESEQLKADLARIEETVLARRTAPEVPPDLERPPGAPPAGPVEPVALAADLDRAAAELRRRFQPGTGVPPVDEPADEAKRPAEPPRLRSALVRMAVDEPEVAAWLMVGLLPAQGALLDEPLRYDLTIRGVGTFAVDVDQGRAEVTELPRRRRTADFHLVAHPDALAEMLAGRERPLGYFTRGVRVKGRASDLVADLWKAVRADLSLEAAVAAGAKLEPEPVYRAFAYVIDPEWTRGHAFTVAQEILGEGTWYVTVADGARVDVRTVPPEQPVAARVAMPRATFDRLVGGRVPAPGERPAIRGDVAAVELLRSWIERARGSAYPPA